MGGGVTGIWWVEAKDAANDLTMHWTEFGDHPVQNVNSAEVENSDLY